MKDLSRCKFADLKLNLNQKWNNDKCRYGSNKYRICKKKEECIWNTSTCVFKIDEYLKNYGYMKSFINASFCECDEIVGMPETVSTSFNDMTTTYNMNYYILHPFLLVTILLSVIITICYYCIKHWLKQKSPYYDIDT